jgi:SulP family sulfate permease
LVLDLKNLIYIDTSGADALMALARTCRKKQVRLILSGVDHQPLEMMQRCGLLAQLPEHDLRPDLGQGLAAALGR